MYKIEDTPNGLALRWNTASPLGVSCFMHSLTKNVLSGFHSFEKNSMN